MEYVKTDARTGLRYKLQGDYYVITGESDDTQPTVGIWGQRHLRWLKQNRRVTYTNLLTGGKLYEYLLDIDRQANEQLDLMIQQMATAEGITEQLKVADQMEWVRRMNSIRSRAEEIVITELITF